MARRIGKPVSEIQAEALERVAEELELRARYGRSRIMINAGGLRMRAQMIRESR